MMRAPEIKDPCPIRWDEMRGNSRVRYCDHCELRVQNLSAMSRRGVARVLKRSGKERLCVTYTRRGDGRMVTRGELFRERIAKTFRRTFSWLLALAAPLVVSACQTHSQIAGRISPQCQKTPPVKKPPAATEERVIVTGGIPIG